MDDKLRNPRDGMDSFFNQKLDKDVKFFSRAGYLHLISYKPIAKSWVCKSCGAPVDVERKGGKLTTSSPEVCLMCDGQYFTLKIASET